MIRILLIGAGPHSKRIYIPWIQANASRIQIAAIADLDVNIDETRKYIDEVSIDAPLVPVQPTKIDALPAKVTNDLTSIVREKQINAVLIASEPSTHKPYALWALSLGLHILMDKPITTRPGAAVDATAAKGILEDYLEIGRAYQTAKKRYPHIVCSISAQRRFDTKFVTVTELIKEVSEQTGCPITSIQSSCADGQWRTPDEIVDIEYHGYNHGYGKASHSGYHLFDLIAQFIAKGIPPQKQPNSVEMFSTITRPQDNFAQLQLEDYDKIFKGNIRHKRSPEELIRDTQKFGEIDLFAQLVFKNGENTICTAQSTLLHNSYSQRSWAVANADLYKGNGRVKHEYHCLQQGPLQTIQMHSYQSFRPEEITDDSYAVGGTHHFDIHIFRNAKLIGGKPYEKISMEELSSEYEKKDPLTRRLEGKSKVMEEFVRYLEGKIDKQELFSDLDDHLNSVTLMSGVYQAQLAKNPPLKLPYNAKLT